MKNLLGEWQKFECGKYGRMGWNVMGEEEYVFYHPTISDCILCLFFVIGLSDSGWYSLDATIFLGCNVIKIIGVFSVLTIHLLVAYFIKAHINWQKVSLEWMSKDTLEERPNMHHPPPCVSRVLRKLYKQIKRLECSAVLSLNTEYLQYRL